MFCLMMIRGRDQGTMIRLSFYKNKNKKYIYKSKIN